jgi:hypothetical protein
MNELQIWWLTIVVILGFCAIYERLKIRNKRKIIGYTVIYKCRELTDLTAAVREQIENGWQPFGPPHRDGSSTINWVQVMVKYDN